MNLKNKKILITGAAKRIGKSIAFACAKKGAHIFLHYHHSEKEAKTTAKEIIKLGAHCSLYQADLSELEEVRNLIQQILKTEKRIDILINNASIFYPKTLEKTDEKDLELFFNLHFKTPFLLAQTFGPLMKQKGRGHIINIADADALNPHPHYIAYAASKAALINLSQSLAKALAPEVLVNTICPGSMLAPESYPKELQNKIIQKTLVKKWGGTEEISKMLLHLLESDFITGQNFIVNG